MKIRKYRQSDCKEIAALFYHTVHTVNAKDYTEEQLNAWASAQIDLEKWNQSLQEHFTVVAVDHETIVTVPYIYRGFFFTETVSSLDKGKQK